LKERAETSLPETEVRLANSKTGRFFAIIDLDKLISTPISLQSQRYTLATSSSNRTRSSPNTTY
jgi:hypothetical protein